MPVDPNILLNFQIPQPTPPGELRARQYQLNDLARRQKLADMELREKEKGLERMTQIRSLYRMGLPADQLVSEAMTIDPQTGMGIAAAQREQRIQALNEEKLTGEVLTAKRKQAGQEAAAYLARNPEERQALWTANGREGNIPGESALQFLVDRTLTPNELEELGFLKTEHGWKIADRDLNRRKLTAETQTAETAAGRNLREEAERKFNGGLTNAERQAKAVEEMFKTAQLNQSDRHHSESLAETKRAHNMADARARDTAERMGLTTQQFTNVQTLARQFDSRPDVREFNTIANKTETVKSVIGRGVSGPGDLAVVYEFMKGLDPSSVVRETEYAAAAKSGNIFQGALAKFNGYLRENGGFLPEAVKREFQSILDAKLAVSRRQVQGVYNDYARRIDVITKQPGTGSQYLTDYTTVLGPETAATVRMRAPNGQTQDVPADQVSHYEKLGAKRISQ
jgi:hypothetical protein